MVKFIERWIGEFFWKDFMFCYLLRTTKEFFIFCNNAPTNIKQWKQKNEKWVSGENNEGGSVGEKVFLRGGNGIVGGSGDILSWKQEVIKGYQYGIGISGYQEEEWNQGEYCQSWGGGNYFRKNNCQSGRSEGNLSWFEQSII